MTVAAFDIVGRDEELAQLRRFLDGVPDGAATLALEGEAGVGKTTLWQWGVDEARARNIAVLVARPAGSETGFAFAALGDLLDGRLDDVADDLPEPQLHALRVALSLDADGGEAVEERVVALGVLGVLRALGRRSPTVVAVDDVQWLDGASRTALEFAGRRLRAEPVRYLVTRRTGDKASPSLALPDPAAAVAVGPLSVGALQHLLVSRLRTSFPRPTLRRLWEIARGNPFYALELARALSSTGRRLAPGEEVPIPTDLAGLLRERVAALGSDAQDALLTVALAGEPTLALLEAATGPGIWERLAPATAAQVVEVAGVGVRFAHPLLAAAVSAGSDPRRRREVHRRLADLVDEPEQRARHLSRATEPPDEPVASALSYAAERAHARGADHAAAELAGEALRFTDPVAGERVARALQAADYEIRIAALADARARLEAEIPRLPPGPDRARAVYLLISASPHASLQPDLVDGALTDAGGDLRLRALILAESFSRLVTGDVDRVQEAGRRLAEAVELARSVGDPLLELRCRANLAWAEAALGRNVEAPPAAVQHDENLFDDLDRVRAVQMIWRGELESARDLLGRLHERAEELEDDWSAGVFTVHLFELESRRGDWNAAARLYADLQTVAAGVGEWEPVLDRCTALLAATRGERSDAEAAAAAVVSAPDATRWQRLEATRALGVAALAAGEPAEAVPHLREVVDTVERAGLRDPGAFPAAPGLIEALALLGRREEAEAELERLTARAVELSHPWGLAVSARCRGLLTGEEAALRDALDRHERLDLPFDRARVLLALGRLQRRSRRGADARRTLGAALAAFEELGARPWAEQARTELGRIGGRRPSGTELTPAEARVARLVAAGRTNKEAAAALFLSVNTIESTLRRVYAKLGVRSRAELARRFRS